VKVTRAMALGAALLALASCARLPVAEPRLEGEYGKLLRQETRRATLYQGLEVRLFVHAVRQTPELVRAQAALLSTARTETPAQTADRLAQLQRDNAAPVFVAVVYTPEASWSDWESKSSVWRLALQGCGAGPNGGDVAPTKVERFDVPFSADLIALYPYLDEFSSLYRLTFPAGSSCAEPKLLIAGTLGQVTLSWAAGQ